MRASEIIKESFDQPYPIQWEESDYGDIDALAKLDDGTYLSIMFNNSGMDSWNVEFHRNNSQEVTGEGDAPRIFATVLIAIQQFIQEYNPHIVYFSAVKDQDPKGSRAKLYDRLVQRYASQLGYAVKRITRDDEVGYNLVRIQKGLTVEGIVNAINESLSRIVYHYTAPQAALKILKTGQFELSSALGSPAEQQYMPKGKPYFMSTTRTKLGGFHRDSVHSRGVMFVLDGDWFNRHYLSRPIDYWENRGSITGRASEAEDRVYSAEPTIPIGGVQSVHVYLDVEPAAYNDKEQDANQRAVVRELLIAAKTQGIPAYFYTDRNAWFNLDTRKQGDVKTLTGARKPNWYRPSRRRTYMQNWIELIGAKNQNQLSKDADKLRYNLNYDYDKRAAAESLAIDMSNARKPDSGPERNDAIKIIAYMRQHKLNTLGDFVNHIANKWKAVN